MRLFKRKPEVKTMQPQREPVVTTKIVRPFRRIIISSPYAGKTKEIIQRHLNYASDACRDSVKRGENPFAPHLYYTQFLSDTDQFEREQSITMAYQMWDIADSIVFYLDLGLSAGMRDELNRAFHLGLTIERRFLMATDARPQPIESGKSLEDIINEATEKEFTKQAEVKSDALDQDARTDGSEDSSPEPVRQGQHLQRT